MVNFLVLVYSKFCRFCCQYTYLDFAFVVDFNRLDRQQYGEGPGCPPVTYIYKKLIQLIDIKAYWLTCNQLNIIPLLQPVSFLLELVRWTQVLNRRSHELLHAVYTTPRYSSLPGGESLPTICRRL